MRESLTPAEQMICLLAEKFQTKPSQIVKWGSADAMLMMRYYREQSKARQPEESDSPENMARMYGVPLS